MLKTPTKPYSAPPYIQEKTDKRVSSFYKKPHTFHGAQTIWCVWSYRGTGRHTFSHRAQRLPQGQDGTFCGVRGNTMEQDVLMLAYGSRMLDIFGVFICQWICRACMGSCLQHTESELRFTNLSSKGDSETLE